MTRLIFSNASFIIGIGLRSEIELNKNSALVCFCLFILLLLSCPCQYDSSNSNITLHHLQKENDLQVSDLSVGDADFTWTARDSPTPSEFLSMEIEGDHITIHATSTDFPVIDSRLYMDPFLTFHTELVPHVDDGFDPYSDNIFMHDSHFSWLMIGGSVDVGISIHVVFEFDTSNCDVMAWRSDTNTSNWYYSNNVFQTTMTTATNPEMSHIDWPVDENGIMYFAFYNHASTLGNGFLNFYREEFPKVISSGASVSYDTYNEPGNVIKPVLYVAKLGPDRSYGYVPRTTFINYFPPSLDLYFPRPEDNWTEGQHDITWAADDRNSDDEIWFELQLRTGGSSEYIELDSANITYDPVYDFYHYTLDAAEYLYKDNYYIRISAHDNDTTVPGNWPDFISSETSGLFSFGSQSMPTPVVWPIVHNPSDIQFTTGELGHSLIWTVVCDYDVDYSIWLENEVIFEGHWTGGTIELPLGNLTPGVYHYRLYIPETSSNYVTVTVLAANTSTTTGGPTTTGGSSEPMNPVLFLNIGLIGVILMFTILILQHKHTDSLDAF